MHITLTLTENEAQVFAQLLDAAQRHLGLQGSRACGHFQQLLDMAVQAASAPSAAPVEEEVGAPGD